MLPIRMPPTARPRWTSRTSRRSLFSVGPIGRSDTWAIGPERRGGEGRGYRPREVVGKIYPEFVDVHPCEGGMTLDNISCQCYHLLMLDIQVIDDPAAATVALEPMRSRLLSELAAPASAATLATRG